MKSLIERWFHMIAPHQRPILYCRALTQQSYQHRYLDNATDICDLERRIREHQMIVWSQPPDGLGHWLNRVAMRHPSA